MMKPLEFERISIEEATKTIDRNVRPGSVKDWDGERRPAPVEPLTEAAAAWLASLTPTCVRWSSRACFRGSRTSCAKLWKRPAQCDDYIKKLMMNDRGMRKGFPTDVGKEISVLAKHYARSIPIGIRSGTTS